MTTKKAILSLMGIFSLIVVQAQVGVNTQSPKSTFHVLPMKTDGTTAEGIIAPNLSRAELIGKDARYGADQRGAMVYVSAVNGTVNAKVAKITEVGYYYFDGNIWQPFTSQSLALPTEPWLVQGGTTEATTNAEDIYQTGSVAIGSNSAGAYKFQVTGTSNITGNSRVGSSSVLGAQSVAGNHTVTGTATLNGTTNTKAVNISGTLNYKPGGTAPAANTYLRTDATGNATWQALPVTATTEPWRVQGGTTNATTNAQNIYQAGKVAIGVAQSGSARTESLYVSGATRLNDNTIIGTGGAMYSDTNYALHVMGEGTLGGMWVEKYANFKARVTVGQDLTNTDEGFSVAKGISRFYGPTFISGLLSYKPNGTAPTANTYLRTDANGNATWQALPSTATTEPWRVQNSTTMATTNAQNIYQKGKVAIGGGDAAVSSYTLEVTGTSNVSGNSRVGSSTVVGAQTVGGNQAVTGNQTVTGTTNLNGATNTKATNISGTLNYKPGGTAPTANTYLRTDATGNATWQALPATATTEPWRVQGGATMATTNTQSIYQKGKVAIGGGDAAVSSYTLEVTGTSNVSGNSRVGSSTVVGAQAVGGRQTVAGTLTAGSATALPAGALFGVQTMAPNAGIANSTKGLMYPRLKLAGPISLAPMIASGGTAAEKLQHIGLTIYHIGGNNMDAGLFYWNGVQWLKILTGVPVITSVIADLKTSLYAPLLDWNQPQNAANLDFGNLEVKEDGSYALMLRFYGEVHENRSMTKPTSMVASSIYVWVFRSGVTTAADAAELSYTAPPYGMGAGQGSYVAAFTAALTVPNAKRGEILTIKIGTNRAYPRFNYYIKAGTAPAAARTSLYYWKL